MSLKPFIYFYDCIPNADASLVIHIIQCSQLSHEPDRGYLGMAAPVPFAERKRRFPRNHLSFVHTVAMKVPLIQITNNRFWDRLMSIPFSILGDQLFFSAKGVVTGTNLSSKTST